jgi:hypothetical protein
MKKLAFLFCVGICMVTFSFAQQTTDTTLNQYIGKYKFPEGSVVAEVIVKLDNGAFTMESSAGVSALEKQGDDLYTIVQFQGTAKFNRDSNKKVIGVSINAMGYVLEGTKTEATMAMINNRQPLYLQARPIERAQVR